MVHSPVAPGQPQDRGQDAVTRSERAHSTSITSLGGFRLGQFTNRGDGHGGTVLTLSQGAESDHVVSHINVEPGQTLLAHGVLPNYDFALDVYAGTAGIKGGAVELFGTATNRGAIDLLGGMVAGGAPATATIELTGVLTNAGRINIQSGGAYPAVAGTGAVLTLDGRLISTGYLGVGSFGDLPGAASLSIAATGALSNAGTIDVFAAGADRTGDAANPGSTLADAGLLTNSGVMRLFGGSTGAMGAGNGSVVAITGIMVNTGSIELSGGNPNGVGGGPLCGAMLNVSGYGYLSNLGTIEIQAGSVFSSGNHSASGAVLDVTASMYNGGTLLIDGSLGFQGTALPPSGTLMILGSLANHGAITIGGGHAGGNGSSHDPYKGLGGVVVVDGMLTNNGTLTGAGGAGSVGIGINTGGTLEIIGSLVNTGLVELQPGHTYYGLSGTGATLIDSGILTNLGTLQIDGAATSSGELAITTTGTLIDRNSIDGTGTLSNDGILTNAVSSTVSVVTVINDATIAAASSASLTISSILQADAGQHGLLTMAANSDLILNGAVGPNQSAVFVGLGATLTLGHAFSFAGAIDDFRPQDTIDLAGLIATTATTEGTLLAVGLLNGTTLDLTLGAPLPLGDMLALQSDQHGGTDLTVNPPSSVVAVASFCQGLPSRDAAGLTLGGVLTVHLPA
jgi:hypothetical protein